MDFAVAARELMSLAVLHHKELQRILETYPQTQKLPLSSVKKKSSFQEVGGGGAPALLAVPAVPGAIFTENVL